MAKFPTYEEMAKEVAEKALDDFLYDGKSIREWMQIIASEDTISRQAVNVRLEEIINEMETIFADIREKNVDDSVCGLCEYDCDHGVDGNAFECLGFEKDDCFKLKDEYRKEWTNTEALPPVTPQPKIGKWIKKPR